MKNQCCFSKILGSTDFATLLLRVHGSVIHPSYTERGNLYDIAILQLQKPIQFSPRVGSICLPFNKEGDSFAGEEVTLLGKCDQK